MVKILCRQKNGLGVNYGNQSKNVKINKGIKMLRIDLSINLNTIMRVKLINYGFEVYEKWNNLNGLGILRHKNHIYDFKLRQLFEIFGEAVYDNICFKDDEIYIHCEIDINKNDKFIIDYRDK